MIKTVPANPVTNHSTAEVGKPSVFSTFGKMDPLEPGIRAFEFGQIEKIMWDANILFSSGRLEEVGNIARAAQEKGLEAGYDMAIALFRLDGNKQAFEDLAVEYAVQTGNSPPVWLDIHDTKKVVNSAPKQIVIKLTNLTAESIIETTIKLESPWPTVLDFEEVGKVDAAGLDIFQESISGRIQREEKTVLLNSGRFLKNIVTRIKGARYEGNAGLWTFCFNACRLTGNKDEFDNLAVDFVEKTDEDLPVWTDLRDPEDLHPEEKREQQEMRSQVNRQGYDIGESLNSLNPAFLKNLAKVPDFINARTSGQAFALDFSNVKRWTIADMANILSLLKVASSENVKFDFLNLNEMLLALMNGFSIEKQAKLVVAGGTT